MEVIDHDGLMALDDIALMAEIDGPLKVEARSEMMRRLAAARRTAPSAPSEEAKEVTQPPSRCAPIHNTARIHRHHLSCREQASLCTSRRDFSY